jgi:hypothetical protein
LQSLIGDAFPRVLPAAERLLNCDSDRIQCKYNWVLNQLASRHLLFHKLLQMGCDLDSLSEAQFLVRINKANKELEEFMKVTKKDCHKYIGGHIEWCPVTGVWMKHCWLLGQVQVFLNGQTRDPRNLFNECPKHGLRDPQQITQDKLNAEFFICKRKLEYLVKHGPRMRRKFLNNLILTAKKKGDQVCATKIATILQLEKARKGWRRINWSTWKP